MRGALAVLDEAGIAPGPHHVQTAGFTVTGGYRAMSRMLEHPDPPTAVFAFSDEMAIGAIRAAREHGLRVPEDLSVAGFDDHDVAWALDLTTVAQPVMGLGETVTELLLEHLRDPSLPPTHEIREVTLKSPRQHRAGAGGAGLATAMTLDRCPSDMKAFTAEPGTGPAAEQGGTR